MISRPFPGAPMATKIQLPLGILFFYLLYYYLTAETISPSLRTGQYSGAIWRTNQTVASTELINTKWLRVSSHSVLSPSGGDQVIKDWLWIDEADQVNILVQLASNGKYALFRQVKYGIHGQTLATVGGLVERGETPLEAAKRELLEEMDLESDDWVALGTYRVHVNRGDGHVCCFLARGAVPSKETAASDDLEEQQWVELTREELLRALMAGELQEVKWTATVALALLAENK